jgi:hypothetical protein
VERYVGLLGRRAPLMEAPPSDNFWECYIGIVLCHRRLWDECGGYDESFIYYSYMEFDLFLRLASRYEGVDLGPVVDHDFAHLDHLPSWLTWQNTARVENVIRTPEDPPPRFCPTGPDWGLARHELALEPASARRPAPAARDVRWRPSHWPELAWATAASTVQTLVMLVRDQVRLRGIRRGIAHALLVSTGIRARLRGSES